jgi:hypothetical protein
MQHIEKQGLDEWLTEEMEKEPKPDRFIPEVLIALDQWVTWKTIERDNKPTKVPFQLSGHTASSTDPNTWTSFEEVKDEEFIGFVFSKTDDLVFIDLDKCYDGSKAEPWAQKIIDMLDSYTEISPSNTGFHIFIKGAIPGPKRRTKRFEMYQDGRYSTITGNVYQGKTEIKETQSELNQLYRVLFPDAPSATKPIAPSKITMKDKEILDIAFSAINGAKIRTLWEGGWNGDYPSQSEADFALLAHLAFYTQDSQQLDRLFRGSMLIRPKWDRSAGGGQTYGQYQITHVLSSIGETYSGPSPSVSEVADDEPEEEIIDDVSEIFRFDDSLMIGIAKEFADVYHDVLPEIPKHFFYFLYLTCFGNIIADKVKFKTVLAVSARLYLLLLGKSGKTRKSTAARQVISFFTSSMLGQEFFTFMGAGSGEGLGRVLSEHPRTLYYIDELRTFMVKSAGDKSSLLPMTCQLYDSDEYDNYLAKTAISVIGCNLSIIGACTIKTFDEVYKDSHQNIGLASRFFLVPGEGRRIGLPDELNPNLKAQLDSQLKDSYLWVNDISQGQNVQGTKLISLNPDAQALYDNEWIPALDRYQEDSKDEDVLNRIEVQTIKMLMLQSCLRKESIVDVPLLQNTIDVMKWQIEAREELTPTPFDNSTAYFEVAIVKQLKKAAMTHTRLMNRLQGSIDSKGLWYFTQALNNLKGVNRVCEGKVTEGDRKDKLYLQ